MIRIIWPDVREIPDEIIAQWYADAVANEEIELDPAATVWEKAQALADIGEITLRRRDR